jgi:hypothetical protein
MSSQQAPPPGPGADTTHTDAITARTVASTGPSFAPFIARAATCQPPQGTGHGDLAMPQDVRRSGSTSLEGDRPCVSPHRPDAVPKVPIADMPSKKTPLDPNLRGGDDNDDDEDRRREKPRLERSGHESAGKENKKESKPSLRHHPGDYDLDELSPDSDFDGRSRMCRGEQYWKQQDTSRSSKHGRPTAHRESDDESLSDGLETHREVGRGRCCSPRRRHALRTLISWYEQHHTTCEQYLTGPMPTTSSTRILLPRFLI